MSESIISRIHLILMSSVDGPTANRFSDHISNVVGDLTQVNQNYTEEEQLSFLSTYWIQQLTSVTLRETKANEYNLIACKTGDEFITVFTAVVLPSLKMNHTLPDLSLPIIGLNTFSHTRCVG